MRNDAKDRVEKSMEDVAKRSFKKISGSDRHVAIKEIEKAEKEKEKKEKEQKQKEAAEREKRAAAATQRAANGRGIESFFGRRDPDPTPAPAAAPGYRPVPEVAPPRQHRAAPPAAPAAAPPRQHCAAPHAAPAAARLAT